MSDGDGDVNGGSGFDDEKMLTMVMAVLITMTAIMMIC
jgi:hypothetical protein